MITDEMIDAACKAECNVDLPDQPGGCAYPNCICRDERKRNVTAALEAAERIAWMAANRNCPARSHRDGAAGMITLADLIRRLEAATGPDRKLDAKIARSVGWRTVPGCGPQPLPDWISPTGEREVWPPRYTGSIDAALSLVPDGYRTLHAGESINGRWFWGLHMDAGHPNNPTTRDGVSFAAQFESDPFFEPIANDARSAALAICIASLRARAATERTET